MLNVYMNRIFTYETYIVCIRGPWPQIECLTVRSGADVIVEIRCTVNVTHLNHPKTIPPTPGPWKSCIPWNWSLVPKRLRTAGIYVPKYTVSHWKIFFHRQIISPMDTYGVFIILKEICILWKDLWCLFLVVFTDTFMGRLFKNHTWPQIFTEF